jgi:transketolase
LILPIAQPVTVEDFSSRGAIGPVPRLYGEALLREARRNPNIVCLCADLPGPTETDLLRDAMPERYIEAGIAEANMVGMAAGMARCGEIPFVHSFCVFLTRRSFDQVANQIAYPSLPVKLIGFLPGLTTPLGVSHQAIDDIALMRSLPNMTILEPSGPEQLGSVVEAALAVDGPVYVRIKRPDGAWSGTAAAPIRRGRGDVLRDGPDGVIIASGLMVEKALEAAQQLAQEGVEVSVLNMSSIKPLDNDLVIEHSRRSGIVVTAENHSVIGGLGAAVADTILQSAIPVGFASVGIQDTFGEGGTTPYLFAKYGLTAAHIKSAYRQASERRNLVVGAASHDDPQFPSRTRTSWTS